MLLCTYIFMEFVPSLITTQHSTLHEKTSTLTDPCTEVPNSTALEITVWLVMKKKSLSCHSHEIFLTSSFSCCQLCASWNLYL